MENFRLRVFRAVAEEMSFRKAAEVLHLSQPAVSQQIRALEEEAGARLFDRAGGEGHGTQISLTEAGRVLLGYATKAAETMAEAQRALAALNDEVVGELELGGFDDRGAVCAATNSGFVFEAVSACASVAGEWEYGEDCGGGGGEEGVVGDYRRAVDAEGCEDGTDGSG